MFLIDRDNPAKRAGDVVEDPLDHGKLDAEGREVSGDGPADVVKGSGPRRRRVRRGRFWPLTSR